VYHVDRLRESDEDRMARVRRENAASEARLAAMDRAPDRLKRRLRWLDERERALREGPKGTTVEARELLAEKMREIAAERARLIAMLPEAEPAEVA
jgi:hypothetical protein